MAKGFGKNQNKNGNGSIKGQKAYRAFLDEILWATANSLENRQFIFWFIEANQNKLNDGFVEFLRRWVKPNLAKESLEKAELKAILIIKFSVDIFEFPRGDQEITAFSVVMRYSNNTWQTSF